jgi:hypothetical protein
MAGLPGIVDQGGVVTDGLRAFERQVDQALVADQPFAQIRSLVVEWRQRGCPKDDLYEALGTVVLRLREAGREADEDIVLDVMDQLVGWCRPDARIE